MALAAHFIASAALFAALPQQAGLVNAVVGAAFKDGAPISNLDVGSALPGGFGAELKKGHATLQVLDVPSMPVAVEQNGATVRVQAVGLYLFDEDRGTVSVYKGSARVTHADGENILSGGEGAHLVSHFRKFMTAPDPTVDLFAWNAESTEFPGLVSEDPGRAGNRPSGNSSRPGWYWDRFWNSYSLLPSVRFLSPAYIPNTPLPWHGDSYLYGSPVLPPSHGAANIPAPHAQTPSVPLTGPGVPAFPNSRTGGSFGKGDLVPPQ